jgi:hypothetical protein
VSASRNVRYASDSDHFAAMPERSLSARSRHSADRVTR